VSSERPVTVRQSASYFSNSDIELVYGSQLVEGNSTSRNSIDGCKDKGAIFPPLGSTLGDQHNGQRAEPSVAGQEPGVAEEQQGTEPAHGTVSHFF
jgi:hypothetical protein